MNLVVLIGNIGKDVEYRTSDGGLTIANFSLATSSSRKGKTEGEWETETEWHRVVAFGKNADTANKHLHKGSKVSVRGRLRTNKWQDNEGKDRWTTEVIADELILIDSNKSGGNEHQSFSKNTDEAAKATDEFNDDIPF